jgi:hypothetical protein
VGHGFRSVLTPVYDDAEQAPRAQLGRTSVADVLRESIASG